MTWRLPEQDPCTEPCCTGEPFPNTDEPAPVVIREPDLRECGVTGYTSCNEVYRWIQDTDPDPAPGGGDRLPGHGKARPLKREPGGVSTQPTSTKGTTNGYQH